MTAAAADGSGGERHASLFRATYQRAGAGKRRTSLTFDPAVVADPRAWLEERIGPLARFELDPQPMADAPSALPNPSAAPVGSDGLQAVQLLQQRLRLAALVERLHDARPRRTWGVRELDRQVWETAARDAAGLPTDTWSAWRATFGMEGAGWPPGQVASPPTGDAHR